MEYKSDLTFKPEQRRGLCTWQSKFYSEFLCEEPKVNDGPFCILHLKEKTKNKEEFKRKIEQKQEQELGKFDFQGTFFPDKTDFSRRVLRNANFSECTFCEEADFSYSDFEGEAAFRGAIFQKGGNFWHSRFLGLARFQEIEFQKAETEVSGIFRSSQFKSDASFRYASFKGSVSFQNSEFWGRARFRHTEFVFPDSKGATSDEMPKERGIKPGFIETRFHGKFYFECCNVRGEILFDRCEFDSAAFFHGPIEDAKQEHTNNKLSPGASPAQIRLRSVLFGEPEKVRFAHVDLTRTEFAGSNLRRVEFLNVMWPRVLYGKPMPARSKESGGNSSDNLRCRIYRFLSHNGVLEEVCPERENDHAREERLEKGYRLCRDLKASLEDRRDYENASDFKYGEMECRRKLLRQPRKFLYLTYWAMCGYGEKPLRAFCVFMLIWFLLGWALTHTEFTFEKSASWRESVCFAVGCRPSIVEALGQSIRLLTLQHRGGYMEGYSPWAHRLTLAANLVGPAQLGLFFLAMRRRFRR